MTRQITSNVMGLGWGNRGKEDPAAIYMLILGDKHEKDTYDAAKMAWQSVNMYAARARW